jgi:hypothetical protein
MDKNVRCLVTLGAEAEAVNVRGETSLFVSTLHDKFEVAQYLLEEACATWIMSATVARLSGNMILRNKLGSQITKVMGGEGVKGQCHGPQVY